MPIKVAIFTLCSDPKRQWQTAKWNDLINLCDENFDITWHIHGDSTKKISNKKNTNYYHSIQANDLINHIKNVNLVFTNDTAPAHIARYFSVSRLVIGGGGTWPRFKVDTVTELWAYKKLKCYGCDWYCSQPDSKVHYPCITEVSVHDVLPLALELLSRVVGYDTN